MGVHGLWPLLHPVARPVALETMGGKKLAIDSSIWLYQFQIAMRDKEGRALDNAHILGFLRRICKLLFYGIKPVFVFDGGAPTIKKVAISNRKNRKQGAKESAARTAEKLLVAQLRAAAIKQARKESLQKQAAADAADNAGNGVDGHEDDNDAAPPAIAGEGGYKYMDEDYGITPRGAPQPRPRGANSSPARGANSPSGAAAGARTTVTATAGANATTSDEDLIPKKKKYIHKDQYALPVIEGPISSRGAPSDPRLATEAELRSFIEDMKPEDFDMDSEFFQNLPVEAKYEIIGDLRIKSRQRNSKRVEAMKNAPTPLDFSRAQIMGLSHRNELTQKLLTMTDSLSRVMPMSGPVRIAGERNKEYVLIKNDTSEGTGYILGVRGGGETASTPVKIEGSTTEDSDIDKTTTDEEFEQVAIPQSTSSSASQFIRKKSSSPDLLEKRREMAKEAIRQRYSPIKPTRGDSPVDDLPALPPQRPLFINDENEPSSTSNNRPKGKRKAKTAPHPNNGQNDGGLIPDFDTWTQISSAVAQADQQGARLSRDEEEDLQRAIEASRRDMPSSIQVNGQTGTSTTEESGDESDISFDEVETTVTGSNKVPSPTKLENVQRSTAPVTLEDSDDDSVEYVRVDEPQQQQQPVQQVNQVSAKPASQPRFQAKSSLPKGKFQMSSINQHSNKIAEELHKNKIPTEVSPPPQEPAARSQAQAQPASLQSQASAQSLQQKKPPSLQLDIPPAAYKTPSPEEQHGRTPRPDLTEEQARRDTSPQLVEEHDGIVERDYAQQPRSPAKSTSPPDMKGKPETPAQEQVLQIIEPSNTAKLSVAPKPSLMERTLSNTSNQGANVHSLIAGQAKAEEESQQPHPLLSTVSSADEQALTGGPISVLDEIKAAMPNEEEGVDKGDLQEEVEDGDVAALATTTNEHRHGTGQNGHKEIQTTTAPNERDSSPEIMYEWSQSPEPAPRERPSDPTLLPPDDPNYIPPDIDFPEPGHELSDLDEEDQEHVQSLTSEQVEYAKFLAELKSRSLDDMEQEVEGELSGLREQDKRDKKMADDITVQMAKDIQLLLKVLGLPYVVAPMEAEAQCAELLSRSLVDGVITDDNDVFLFGATKVYKNMFNQNKYVECYLGIDIERELALDRNRLIRLAHFLGSDYCDGLPGVGPVLGMELMAEFPGPNGLFEFRDWWLKVQRGRDTPADHPTAFRRKFKKSKKDLYIDESWPNPEVARAYLHPTVDESDQPFMWGIPDLDALREFLHSNLGWGQTKTDELMLPIIRKMTGRAAGGAVNQSTISNFFDVSGGTGRFAPMSNKGYQSKRLQAVVKAWRQSQQRLAKEEGSDEDDDAMLDNSDDDLDESVKGKGRAARPNLSRRNSRNSSRPSSSRRSSKRGSSQAEDEEDEETRAFNEELEAKLEKMGVKRKRETPVGSTRVVKPAKRSNRGGGRLAARARQDSMKNKSKEPLFAEDSDAEQGENEGNSQSESQSQLQPKKSGKKAAKSAKKAVLADSDEYEE